MAVIKAQPEVFVDQYLFPLVERKLITPLLVTRVADDKFIGAQNQQVNFKLGELRTRARRQEFRTRSRPIVMDDIEGGDSIPVFLNTHTYTSTGLTLEHLTLDNIKFTQEVINPQTRAIADQLEEDVAFAFANMRFKYELPYVEGETDPYELGIDAGELLDRHDVPDDGNRFWLVGSRVWAAIAKSKRFTTVDKAGEGRLVAAISRAEVGEIAGWRIVKSRAVAPNASWFMHKSLLVLGNVAPVVPEGAKIGRRYTQDNWDMTWIQDYDGNFQRDRSTIQTFTGLTPIYDERVGGEGRDRHDLKKFDNPLDMKSVRAVKVNFTPAAGQILDDLATDTVGA